MLSRSLETLSRALVLETAKLRHAAGDNRHWHLLMLAYSLLKLSATSSALVILARATSLRNDIRRSFRESVQSLLSWALNSPNHSTDELMQRDRWNINLTPEAK